MPEPNENVLKVKRFAGEFRHQIEKAGYDTLKYSGRCMSGKYCLAYQVDGGVAAAIRSVVNIMADTCGTKLYDELCSAFQSFNYDQLGMGSVLYFPSIPYPED